MSAEPIASHRPLKFLVVDDSRAIQAIIRRAIANCGFDHCEIRLAADGAQALEVIGEFAPDLVITDWHMPKVSGLELLQVLRQMGHTKVRVGFVTTERTPALLDQAIGSGAMFILNKPFDDDALMNCVMASVRDLIAPIAQLESSSTQGGHPLTPDFLQALLQTHLGKIPFRVIAKERMTVGGLTPTNLLGLYSAPGRKGVYAVAVVDANAICMIGGGAVRMPPTEVRAAMAAQTPSEKMVEQANAFLAAAAKGLSQSAPPGLGDVALARSSVVKNTFSKLAEVLAQTDGRADFRIAIPGYGEGRLAFFVMDI